MPSERKVVSNVHQLPLGNSDAPIGLGAKGEGVRVLQKTLNALRVTFIPVPETGEFDLDTSNAVKAFQVRAGIEPTGEVDAATKAKLQEAMPKTALAPAKAKQGATVATPQKLPLWQLGLMVLGGLALVGGAYWMVTKDEEESDEGEPLAGTKKRAKDMVVDAVPSSHAVPLKKTTPTTKCPRTPDDKALASGEVISA